MPFRYVGCQGTHLDALHRHAEQYDALQTFLNQWRHEFFEPVNAPSALPGEGCNDLTRIGVVSNEDRVHEHGFGELTPVLPGAGQGVVITALQN
jgi:hypothetical protein